ncbi:MAG: hypothetical protein D6702_07405 [Planctomycetota bacterium]|nr:MAG: hypothetical protein D6702_07405 [Planctomycetota bacterium]
MRGIFASALLLGIGVGTGAAFAQDAPQPCLDCHEEPGAAAAGVHPLDDCLLCHTGLAEVDFAAGEFHEPEQAVPDCSGCHPDETEELAGTPHQEVGLECASCHGGHEIQPAESWRQQRFPEICLGCHEDLAEEIRGSVHHTWSEHDSRPYPGCLDCHRSVHAAGNPSRSRLARKQDLAAACGDCHEKDVQDYLGSSHHQALFDADDERAPACSDCHGSHAIDEPHHHLHEVSRQCETCHQSYRLSLHHEPGSPPPDLDCTVCHSGHLTSREHVADRLFPAGGLQNCTYCHSTDQHQGPELAHDSRSCSEAMGREVRCIDCHTFHWRVEDGEPIPDTSHRACESCHQVQGRAYALSVHGRSRAAGNEESPYCTDCHGPRGGIKKASIEFAEGSAVDHCEKCHGDEELMFSFGVNPYVVGGFRETYHGELYDVGNTGKDRNFANCTDCHGHHEILEPEDPESSVNPAHILDTCRKCHQDADEKFTGYVTHPERPTAAEAAAALAAAPPRQPTPPRPGADYLNPGLPTAEEDAAFQVLHAADVFMKGLFFTVMAFFLVHTLLWFQKGIRQRYGPRRIYYRRFGPYERMLHVLVNVSFLALAFTGLPQTFSHTWLGRWVLDHVMSIQQAQTIHYWAAAVTALYFALHLAQVAVNLKRKGWRRVLWGPDSLVPRLKDLNDFRRHLGWFLGLCERPRFDRWTYWEKFDYLAVFWGVAVIGLSGLIRWQEEFFGNLLGGGAVSFATTVHKEEALLATAFIFLVHFFNTHLRSEKFPMDVSIYTGVISEDELREERPEQFERLLAAGELERLQVAGRSSLSVWLAYLWGAVALFLGLFLLAMIILGFLS